MKLVQIIAVRDRC